MSTIGKNIQAARESRNMTLQDLASKARIGVHTIEKYENGEKVPTMQTILKLSTLLDIPASELLTTAIPPRPSGNAPEIEQLID